MIVSLLRRGKEDFLTQRPEVEVLFTRQQRSIWTLGRCNSQPFILLKKKFAGGLPDLVIRSILCSRVDTGIS